MEVTLPDAARRLNTTPDAIRQRIRRGTLPGVKRDGRWYVRLDATEHDASATGEAVGHDELSRRVADLTAERDYLRQALAAALTRIPQLPPPREDIVPPAGSSQPSQPSSPGRSWWQRLRGS
jgi:hypothetical protein